MTAPIRALVVDDLRDSSESLARMLQFMGCSATWVTRAAKAMDAAEALEAEIVVLDIGMPEIDGYELARLFRKRYGEAIRSTSRSSRACCGRSPRAADRRALV